MFFADILQYNMMMLEVSLSIHDVQWRSIFLGAHQRMDCRDNGLGSQPWAWSITGGLSNTNGLDLLYLL